MMGNRGGRFHKTDFCRDVSVFNSDKRLRNPELRRANSRITNSHRPWAAKQWICCVLDFKNRQRNVWGDGYTELFFLDEVTALSAGHRPCFECRRADAKAFQAALFTSHGAHNGWLSPPKVAVMDALLHTARIQNQHRRARLETLPVGAMFKIGETVFAKATHGLLAWTFDGYCRAQKIRNTLDVTVLTPEPILGVLLAGYQPKWHISAHEQTSAKDTCNDD
ncbi:MAG: hypothetical protein AB8B88_06205 [Devosiaceae bacterium]